MNKGRLQPSGYRAYHYAIKLHSQGVCSGNVYSMGFLVRKLREGVLRYSLQANLKKFRCIFKGTRIMLFRSKG